MVFTPDTQHKMTEVQPPQDSMPSPQGLASYSPRAASPHHMVAMDPSLSPNENLSPSRKAILDKFNNITMGPPLAQPDFTKGSVPPREHMSPGRRSPFKRALMNSQRGNTTSQNCGTASSASDKFSSSSGAGDSSFSIRLSANTSMDYDLMKDDSFLAEARNMGEESFDRKLRQQVQSSKRSPGKAAGASALQRQSPRKASTATSASPASPFVKPAKGNALGLGFPSPSRLTSSIIAGPSTSANGARSFSLISETSNIFDERGEESLLYTSTRIKANLGNRGGSRNQKLLDALAEGREEDVLPAAAVPADTTPAGATRSPSRVAPTLGSPARRTGARGIARISAAAASSSTAPRPRSSIVPPTTGARMTPSSSRSGLAGGAATTVIRRGQVPASTPSASTRGSAPLSTPRTARPSTTPSSSTSAASQPLAVSTPRSRPPLNASAARMRRLSALPQLMDEQGKPKTPVGARPAVRALGVRTVAPAASSTSSPVRATTATATPRTTARPSVAIRSTAQSRPSIASAAPAHRSRDSPKATRTVATPRKIEPAVALTGQLHRRASSVPSREGIAASSASAATGKRPARPFLLGKGTNQTATASGGDTAPSSPRRAAPVGATSARKSIATTTTGAPVARAMGKLGMPKSSSTSQISTAATGARTSRVGGGLPTPVRSTGWPRPSLARAGADVK